MGNRKIFFALLLGFTLIDSGCSNHQPRKFEGFSKKGSPVSIKGTLDKIEVVWASHEDDIEGFLISYQIEGESDSTIRKVSINGVERLKSNGNNLFGFTINDLPVKRSISISIASYKGGLTSEFSKPFVVNPR